MLPMLTASMLPARCGAARRERPLSVVFSFGAFGRPLAPLGLVFREAKSEYGPGCAPGVGGRKTGPQAS